MRKSIEQQAALEREKEGRRRIEEGNLETGQFGTRGGVGEGCTLRGAGS
jgi:hypothetical protein